MPASCSACFSGCIRRVNLKVPASAWPMCNASFIATADVFGLKEPWTRGQRFILFSTINPKEIRHEKIKMDSAGGRRRTPGGTDDAGARAGKTGVRSDCGPRRRRSPGLHPPPGRISDTRRRPPGPGAAGFENAQGGRPGSAAPDQIRPAAETYSRGDVHLLARAGRRQPQLSTGRQRLCGQTGGFPEVQRGARENRAVLDPVERIAARSRVQPKDGSRHAAIVSGWITIEIVKHTKQKNIGGQTEV